MRPAFAASRAKRRIERGPFNVCRARVVKCRTQRRDCAGGEEWIRGQSIRPAFLVEHARLVPEARETRETTVFAAEMTNRSGNITYPLIIFPAFVVAGHIDLFKLLEPRLERGNEVVSCR